MRVCIVNVLVVGLSDFLVKVIATVKACIVLHNFCCSKSAITFGRRTVHVEPTLVDQEDADGNQIDGTWRQEPINDMDSMTFSANRSSVFVQEIRQRFCDYFSGAGAVPAQKRCTFLELNA